MTYGHVLCAVKQEKMLEFLCGGINKKGDYQWIKSFGRIVGGDVVKEQMKKKWLLVLLFCILIAVSAVIYIAAFPQEDPDWPHPVNGVLNLQNWEVGKGGVLSLNGGWGFYWKHFLKPKELTATGPLPDIIADTPSVWNSYKINGEKLPGFGYGTYVLKIVNVKKGVPLALRVPTFSASYELYIDDVLVSSGGRVGRSREEYRPEYKPQVVEYTPDKTDFIVVVHVSNFANVYAGGMWHAVQLGTPEQIRHMDSLILYRDLILFGAISLMALYYISFFLLRQEDRSSLYFALICVMIAGRILIYGNFLIESLFPFVGFRGIFAIDYI
ncbi:MAG: putative histidine kinase, partial [Bacillota bacterium]|nr:putative histidine kinase [Bacillota bacterium]